MFCEFVRFCEGNGIDCVLWHLFGEVFVDNRLNSFRLNDGIFFLVIVFYELGKKPNGSIPIWSFVVWAPYHAMIRFIINLQRMLRKKEETEFTEIIPGWILGARDSCLQLTQNRTPPLVVIDMTCEFSSPCSLTSYDKNVRYLNLPTWDATPPSNEDIQRGIQFIKDNVKMTNGIPQGKVLIHCAYGKGRSTAMMCCALVAMCVCRNWEEAFNLIKSKRSVVKLNSEMRQQLTLVHSLPNLTQTTTKVFLNGPKSLTKSLPSRVILTDKEWQAKLNHIEVFNVMRRAGTEPSFKNQFHQQSIVGVYSCKGCGAALYHSNDKLCTSSGWPEFSSSITGHPLIGLLNLLAQSKNI